MSHRVSIFIHRRRRLLRARVKWPRRSRTLSRAEKAEFNRRSNVIQDRSGSVRSQHTLYIRRITIRWSDGGYCLRAISGSELFSLGARASPKINLWWLWDRAAIDDACKIAWGVDESNSQTSCTAVIVSDGNFAKLENTIFHAPASVYLLRQRVA